MQCDGLMNIARARDEFSVTATKRRLWNAVLAGESSLLESRVFTVFAGFVKAIQSKLIEIIHAVYLPSHREKLRS